jgi:tetrahydromethanopterin S-methyltransferase subunit G
MGRLRQLLQRIWRSLKRRGKPIGIVFIVLGALLVVSLVLLVCIGDPELTLVVALFAAASSCITIGFVSISIGTEQNSDERYTELVTKIERNVLDLLSNAEAGDKIEAGGEEFNIPPTDTPEVVNTDETRILAQRRLDEDTRKVGRPRGELYQLSDGRWAIHWGGKHLL